ncbi:MAG: GPR1/FUN34/YaaH family transporter [Rhodanobacteraceae bacterium]
MAAVVEQAKPVIAQTKPQANPAALGLVCFGLATVMLSLVNSSLVPAGGVNVGLVLWGLSPRTCGWGPSS